MPLNPGTRIGPYEIRTILGAGGMGEVYRARDTKLERDVAVKVLPDLFAADPERLGRFEREARLLASLNHAHIAQVYGFEDAPQSGAGGPVRALVMELVDGPTLADRIRGGPIPIDETLRIARQIAEALEAAHARGIVHRDLKPANVKLTAGGAVKVLDFGLAKALGRLGEPPTPAEQHAPAFSGPETLSGVVVGTAAYMAPEQARGQPVDARADIWALGVVVYEMLAGERPFGGLTTTDTLAAVLRQEVHWLRLPRDTPQELRRLLGRCLQRDPRNRLHDAADARLMLSEVEYDHHASRVGSQRRRASAAAWLALGALAVASALAFALLSRGGVSRRAGSEPARASVRFTIEPPEGVHEIASVAVAPDGRFAVYEARVDGEWRLFVRRFDALESQPVAGSEGGRGPFLSPDGAWVGFVRNAKLFKVATAGGDAVALCDLQGGPGAAWTSGGRIVFSRAWLSGLSVVGDDGGAPTPLTTPDRRQQEIGHWWPAALPDGRVLFTIARSGAGLNDARIALFDPARGGYTVLFAGAKPSWIPSGQILFFRAGRYHVVPFDLRAGRTTGEAVPVLEDARELDPAGDWGQPVAVGAAALAYLPGHYVPPSRLSWIDAAGRFEPLAFTARPYVGVKLSPDGRRVATASLEAGRLLIRLLDLERGTDEVPRIDGMNWNPVWLPDGRLSYTSMRKGDFDVYVKDVAGTGAETAVLDGPDDTDPIAWTRDGRLVFQGSEPDGAYPLKLFDARRTPPVTRLTEQHVDNGGSLSPDERWVAYQSAAVGRSVVYVRRFDGSAPAVALSPDSGEFPTFLRDGRTLALVRGGRQLVLRSWRAEGGRFEIGPERPLAPLAFGSGWIYGAPYDVARDGRFLALVRSEPAAAPRIHVVLGWDQQPGRSPERER